MQELRWKVHGTKYPVAIQLRQPVRKYVPNFAFAPGSLSLGHLLLINVN